MFGRLLRWYTISGVNEHWGERVGLTGTRWLYCVERPQYSIRLEALGYLCTSCLLRAFDAA